MIASQHFASSGKPGLDLISNEQSLVLVQQSLCLAQIPIIRDDHAGLALNWLHHKGHNVGVRLQLCLQGIQVVVRDGLKPRHERAESCVAAWICGRGDSSERTSPEVILGKQHLCLVFRDALDVISPAPCQLQCSLAALHAGVHWQNLVKPEQLGDILFVLAQDIVEEGPGCECKLGSLICQSAHNFWVTVALVDGRIGAEEVKVALAVDIPHKHSLAALENHGQRRIVVCTEGVLLADNLVLSGAGSGTASCGQRRARYRAHNADSLEGRRAGGAREGGSDSRHLDVSERKRRVTPR
mmetsp:Transcript_16859/g.43198  ORF Transcript_16859/g.43198 Transcript_16859/m.43198 type:complete len:298 (-) Transcript_16859:104-997(-)